MGHMNEKYVQMLVVELKAILTKMQFCMPPELSTPIYTTLLPQSIQTSYFAQI